MEQTECSKTSAYKIQTPGNYPDENIKHSEHDESLKSRTFNLVPWGQDTYITSKLKYSWICKALGSRSWCMEIIPAISSVTTMEISSNANACNLILIVLSVIQGLEVLFFLSFPLDNSHDSISD